jgi:D-amino-acid dehydrogenase
VRIGGTMEINGRNLKITDERLTAIKDATSLYFPEIRKHHFRKTISNRGLRPLSPDGMPYIGNLRRRPNVTIATGHAMVGMSLGAVTGQMVARLVDGEETGFNMEILHPQRFEKA